jgi:chromosome segregation ATPase
MSDTPETDHLENGLGTAAEMSHPTLWAFARKLERERNEAKKELAVWKHEAEIVRAELKKADDAFESNISTYIDLREQRDRLAEALQKVLKSWDDATWLDENEFESFRAALKSLNQPKKYDAKDHASFYP